MTEVLVPSEVEVEVRPLPEDVAVLVKTRESLADPTKWTRHSWSYQGSHCVLGWVTHHLGAVDDPDGGFPRMSIEQYALYIKAYGRLMRVLGLDPIHVNDVRGYEATVAMVDRAIQQAMEEMA